LKCEPKKRMKMHKRSKTQAEVQNGTGKMPFKLVQCASINQSNVNSLPIS